MKGRENLIKEFFYQIVLLFLIIGMEAWGIQGFPGAVVR